MEFKVISFYRYVGIENPSGLKDFIRESCLKLNILGRILISEEGINGAVCGEVTNIESFKKILDNNFKNLTFREQEVNEQVYHKLVTRVRKEMVVFGKQVNLENTGNHVEPEELDELIKNEKDLVIIDARNDYEYDVGRFKEAIKLPIERFRDLPKEVGNLKKYKDKKIVMYCTGGVRCEKASAFLKEQGFKDVNQLNGGIINYINQKPNSNFIGSCFVFDNRLTSKGNIVLTTCSLCGEKSDDYLDCHNMDCDKLFIACEECQKKYNKTCSISCMNSGRLRPKKEKVKEVLGIVTNYFVKNKIAEIKLNKEISKGMKVSFIGKTSNFSQEVNELVEHNENVITIPVTERVRVNDKLVLN